MTTREEYNRLMQERQQIISHNASVRMRGRPQDQKLVPPKPERPTVRVAYEPDGTYAGRLADDEEAPAGYTVKIEPAI